jgi:hypothetical protein
MKFVVSRRFNLYPRLEDQPIDDLIKKALTTTSSTFTAAAVEGISILSILDKMNGIKNASVRGPNIWIIATGL